MNNLEQDIFLKLEHILDLLIFYLGLGLLNWVKILENYWWAIGLVGGWLFISSMLIKDKIIQITFFLVFLLTLAAQPLLYFILPDISKELWNQNYGLSVKHIYAYGVGFILSGIAALPIFKAFIRSRYSLNSM